jgi:hypothetical protein
MSYACGRIGWWRRSAGRRARTIVGRPIDASIKALNQTELLITEGVWTTTPMEQVDGSHNYGDPFQGEHSQRIWGDRGSLGRLRVICRVVISWPEGWMVIA